MQIYAQILVILLTRPAALATAQRVDGIYPLTSSPPSHLLSTQFLSLRSPSYSLSLGPHSFSLSFCLRCSFQQRDHVLSLSACSRCAAGLRQGADGGRWVRGYKTGLARVWRIVFVGHLRRRGFIEVKKVARHRPPAAMKWATIPQARPSTTLLLFLSCAPSSSRFRGYLRVSFFSTQLDGENDPSALTRRRIIIARFTIVLLVCDPRNFQQDIDANKIFYVAWFQ